MSTEKSSLDETTGNLIFGAIFIIGVLYVWHYFVQISKKKDFKNYEAIIREKDKVIERQQEQIERMIKLLKK